MDGWKDGWMCELVDEQMMEVWMDDGLMSGQIWMDDDKFLPAGPHLVMFFYIIQDKGGQQNMSKESGCSVLLSYKALPHG